ncbi:MAG: methyltransferase domain-containing protein [Acidimicrobiia bacterium]|nr:methyltransferase domain-containing protein [Acidimicrobiia bacterium]
MDPIRGLGDIVRLGQSHPSVVLPGMSDEQRIRATYDQVAHKYHRELGAELDGKPLDRALLDAVAELCQDEPLVDLGCGPGHVTAYLAERHTGVTGIDLSPEMIRIARIENPGVEFRVESMLDLSAGDASWGGIIAFYSIIHLTPRQRVQAIQEMSRVLQPSGWLLLSFHINDEDFKAGDVNHLTEWFGHDVDIDGYFIDPDEITKHMDEAGMSVVASTIRQPNPDVEYPSRRCYLLGQKK